MVAHCLQITFSIDGADVTTRLGHDINLIHRRNDVFLGGSYDTRLLTRSYVTSNFRGTIEKVNRILPLCCVLAQT